MPPLFFCLWFTGTRGRACRPPASPARVSPHVRFGTGCARGAPSCTRPGVISRPKATRTVCPTSRQHPNPCSTGIGRAHRGPIMSPAPPPG